MEIKRFTEWISLDLSTGVEENTYYYNALLEADEIIFKESYLIPKVREKYMEMNLNPMKTYSDLEIRIISARTKVLQRLSEAIANMLPLPEIPKKLIWNQ